MSSRRSLQALGCALLLATGPACRKDQGEGELHAKEAALEREAEGLRATLAKLEGGEPILPDDAVMVAVSDSVIKDFLDAQLPFEADAEGFKVKLTRGEAVFRGAPAVHLAGSIWHADHPDLVGVVRAQGALEDIRVEPDTGTLRATIALDHVDLVELGGLEKYLPGGSINELARTVRKQLEPHLPVIQIPVKIEQGVELPSVTRGPVLIQGARMPLAVSVADVFAGNGILWVAVRVVPGELTKTADDGGPAPAKPEPAAPQADKGGQR
jgi:hypothetical protein